MTTVGFSSTADDALEKMNTSVQHREWRGPTPTGGMQNYRLPLRAAAGFLTTPNSGFHIATIHYMSLPLEQEAHVHLAEHRRRSDEILAGTLELTGAAVEFG
jgi:hypothetical protein